MPDSEVGVFEVMPIARPMFEGLSGRFNPSDATWATFDRLKKLTHMKVMLKGIATSGPMAPEISLEKQRPAARVHEALVQDYMEALPAEEKNRKRKTESAA